MHINEMLSLELTQSRNNAGGVEPRGVVVKVTLVTKDGPEFASKTTLHQEVDEFPVLESAVQSRVQKENML